MDELQTSPSVEENNQEENNQEENNQQQQEEENLTPKKKAPSYKKYKISDDEEVSLSDEDIIKNYKKWKGADQKFREAATAKKSLEQFMHALQNDPEQILNDPRLSIDRRKLAEKWLLQQIEAEMNPVDPKDKKLSEYERKLQTYEQKEKEEQEKAQQVEYERVKDQRKREISEVLSKAMEKTILSKNPESNAAVLREMALFLRNAKENGFEVTPEELVQHVEHQRYKQFHDLANQLNGEELIDWMGEAVVKKMREADLTRLQAKRGQTQTHKDESWEPKQKSSKERIDPKTAMERANKIIFGK